MTDFGEKELSEKLASLQRRSEEREAKRNAEKYGFPYIDLNAIPIKPDDLKLVPEVEATGAQGVVIDSKHGEIAVAFLNPSTEKAKDLIKSLESKRLKVKVFVCSLTGLKRALERYGEFRAAPRDEALSSVEIKDADLKGVKFSDISPYLKKLESKKEGSSTTDILDFIIGSAVAMEASDIHFEASKETALLRFRIDGLLYDVYNLSREIYQSVLNRLKLLSGLKINVIDAPQDGRFTTKIGPDGIEIRTSIIPAEYGDAVVMRILDPRAISLNLSDLGLRDGDEKLIREELKRPNGMILVTGPTGSGKTTSLYSFLKAANKQELKIITIEDPIEYHLPGIQQTQVDSRSGYNFSSGLKSILRQDPDIILVGEIRDLETAEIGMHAALTGHLVFSTLHTNDAAGAIPRLVDLGVKASVLAPAINLVVAQRLVRKLCESCKTPAIVSQELANLIQDFLSKIPAEAKASLNTSPNLKLYEASGCDKCRDGFKGRIGIFEFLKCGDEFGKLILKESTEEAIKKLAKSQGMISVQADGMLKWLGGITTLDEVERVTGPIEW
ncbi:MAG: type II/IV secretion system protein [Candidatus Colwellbacteria bacterium]|nr:type II/IV secretion system protein [Candidatus Colwellbacteria bacterium]